MSVDESAAIILRAKRDTLLSRGSKVYTTRFFFIFPVHKEVWWQEVAPLRRNSWNHVVIKADSRSPSTISLSTAVIL